MTDHNTLVGAFNKDLSAHEIPRLLRQLEKTLPYNILLKYIPGGMNSVADTCSRMFAPTTKAEELVRLFVPSMINLAKKVLTWGEKPGCDIIGIVRKGLSDTRYYDFLADIKSCR